jgi:hypothetical protein
MNTIRIRKKLESETLMILTDMGDQNEHHAH